MFVHRMDPGVIMASRRATRRSAPRIKLVLTVVSIVHTRTYTLCRWGKTVFRGKRVFASYMSLDAVGVS